MRSSLLFIVLTACTAEVGTFDEAPGDSADGLAGLAPHFDFSGLQCSADGADCPPDQNPCFCLGDLDHNDYVRDLSGSATQGHFLVVGSDRFRADIEGMGNRMAVNINDLNTDWRAGGVARADAAMAWARRQFPSGVPRWFMVNELSVSLWTNTGATGAQYRRFVVDFARRLSAHHHRKVVVFAPFARPGRHASDWTALARHAYVGVESYLSGREIRAAGFSEAWCRARYRDSLDRYAGVGVPHRKLMLLEHFGHTRPGTAWGRSGVPHDEWLRAIRVRTRAARGLPFAGYVSYAWGSNWVEARVDRRREAQDVYHRNLVGGAIDLPAAGPPPAPSSPAPADAAETPEPASAYLVGDFDGDGVDGLAWRTGNCVHADSDFDGTEDLVQCYGDGDAEAEYLVGDWDGDGRDNLAVRRGNCVHMDFDFDGAENVVQCYGDGDAEAEYLAGDWDGDGRDNLAVRRDNCVHMDFDFDGGEDMVQCYGNGASENGYLAGDWDGDGRDNLAVRRDGCVLMDFDFDGANDATQCYGLGDAESAYLSGDWDGDGRDNLAVRRDGCVLMDWTFDGGHEREQCL